MRTIIDLSHQQYEHMMNGDQPKMDALTPMIGQALNVRDQLRVEMGNQMGLGSDGWASQNPNMLEKKTFGSEPLSTDLNSFTPEQQRKMDVLVGEHLPVNPNHLTPEQRSKADVYVGKDAMAGQYVPSKATPEEQSKRRVIVGEDAGAGQYIDDMTQTFGGMSEGLEATQVNTRESIINSLSPELKSKADVYVGMGYSKADVEAGTVTGTIDSTDKNSNRIGTPEININNYFSDRYKLLLAKYLDIEVDVTVEEFFEKYPLGPEQLDMWKRELIESEGERVGNYIYDSTFNQHDELVKQLHFDLSSQGKIQEDETLTILEAKNEFFEAGNDYVADISEGVDIDEETLNEIVNAGLYDGPLGDQYIELIKNGARRQDGSLTADDLVNKKGVIAQVNGSYEFNLTSKEAAKTFYLIDQKERNRAFNILFDIVQSCASGDPKELFTLLGSWLIEGLSNPDIPLISMDLPMANEKDRVGDMINNINNGMLEEIITKQDPTFIGAIDEALKGKLQEEIINMGLNASDTLHHDMDKLVGGNYIETVFMLHDINSEHSSQMVTVRLIEKDGKYVYDEENPLCFVLYDQSY